jgi:uncharacterized protein (TIGR02271 family)
VKTQWHPIVDGQGQRGSVTSSPSDPSCLEVRLESGQMLFVPRALVQADEGEGYRFAHSFAALLEGQTVDQIFPVIEEQFEIRKRRVERERVRLVTSVSTRDEPVEVSLMHEELKVDRVPIGRIVDSPAPPRQEGDTFVFPVYEEVLVVEKRLVLREEVRVTRVQVEQQQTQTVSIRREEVQILRTPLNGAGD